MRDDCSRVYVQDGEKSLEPLTKIDLNFMVKISFFFFFFLYCVLLVTKIKLFQETISRNLIVLLKNGEKVS